VVALVALVGLLAFGLGSRAPGSPAAVRSGGTFRVASAAGDLDYMDPALSYEVTAWGLLDAACAKLMTYPDKSAPAGLRIIPEVAARPPAISDDAKTFTFTLRTGFRFSDGTPVRASAFAHEINRILMLGPGSQGWQFVEDIVGADAVRDGKATRAKGVTATGNRLVVRLTAPDPDFAARTTMPFFCAVPPNLPVDPEGLNAFPGSGPYYVSQYVPGQRVVLLRNRYYRGSRPHHVDSFVADLTVPSTRAILQQVDDGQADWGNAIPPDYYDPALGLVGKYGTKGPRLFAEPGLTMRGYALNVARPLFRNNLALRRALNYAVDRSAFVNTPDTPIGTASGQYLPTALPGFRDAHLYPVDGPDLKKARALARGHTRSGKAVLWTIDVPQAVGAGQILKRNFAAIGLDVTIKAFPGKAYYDLAGAGGAFDIAFSPWTADYVDPYQYVNVLLESRSIGGANFGRFNSPKYDALMRRAARLTGDARYRAYGDLDVQLARDAAPRVEVANDAATTFVSKRVGCVVLRPFLDLTAACLK